METVLVTRNSSLYFDKGTGDRYKSKSVNMGVTIVEYPIVVLTGYTFDFANKDHHINLISVETFLTMASAFTEWVHFGARVKFADKNFDDPYTASVSVMIIAQARVEDSVAKAVFDGNLSLGSVELQPGAIAAQKTDPGLRSE